MGKIVVNKHFDVKSNITPESFAFCGCLKLSEILIKTLTPPSLDFSTDMEIIDGISYKLYHPFGFRKNSFVGFSTKENGNVLYVPYNKNNGYLTNEDWIKPLQTAEACGFMVEYITLDNIVTLNGSLLNDYQIVYLKSDSGNFVNDGNNGRYSNMSIVFRPIIEFKE